jgi:putative DNA methylase
VKQEAAQQHQVSRPFLYSTDPPYYDNVPYADLADFFYVWLRRILQPLYPQLLSTMLVPKADELVAEPFRHGGKQAARQFFEDGMKATLSRMRANCDAQYPATVYYAFKQSESSDEDDLTEEDGDSESDETTAMPTSTGWETMLEGLMGAGWQITATWPIRTEMKTRMRSMGSNALASSIVLACRPRPIKAPIISRRDFVGALKRELPMCLKDLQSGNIAPVDLAQAAIGPGMAVYSRYAKVLESSGERLTVRTALALINQVLDEVLAEQEGDYDPDTRWSLKWFEQFAHEHGPFSDANTFATAMNIGINGLVETGIVQAKAGKVRLLKRTELMSGRPETWDPATDTDIVHWEVCQYLIHALDTKGEAGAAALLRRINARYPGASETARELAYRLYTICERKKWAQEAMAYNSLIVAWPEIVKLAQHSAGSEDAHQTSFLPEENAQ